MMKQCPRERRDIIVVDEAWSRPYKAGWVAQTTETVGSWKEITADCQQRFSCKMDEKGVTPSFPILKPLPAYYKSVRLRTGHRLHD